MRDRMISEIVNAISFFIEDPCCLRKAKERIEGIVSKYVVSASEGAIIQYDEAGRNLVASYIVSRKIQGCKKSTLEQYSRTLMHFITHINKSVLNVDAIDIRVYLFNYQKERNSSERYLSFIRTVICSFYTWLASEEYIVKNPAIKIPPIKYERKHKKAMTQLDLEKVRSVIKSKKEMAIVELLYSTGCRVSELSALNKSDINFETKEVYLFGKGEKHRTSYLNAKAEVAVKEYLSTREDSNIALIVSDRKPNDRMHKAGIERIIREIESRVPDLTTHITPHVFRHTTATVALSRGMDISDVSRLLGHSKVDTTMEYITRSNESIHEKHKHCII